MDTMLEREQRGFNFVHETVKPMQAIRDVTEQRKMNDATEKM